MLNIENVILKYDLNYSLNEDEQKFVDLLSTEDFVQIRKNVLDKIKSTRLPLDILEENLERLKDEEYNKYVSGILETENLKQKQIELEKGIYSMIINIAKGNADYNSLNPRSEEKEKVSHK